MKADWQNTHDSTKNTNTYTKSVEEVMNVGIGTHLLLDTWVNFIVCLYVLTDINFILR